MAPPPPLPAPQQPRQRIAAPQPKLAARPQITEDDFYYTDLDGYVKCKLCGKYADENHVNSKDHLRRARNLHRFKNYLPAGAPAAASAGAVRQ